MKVLTLLRTTFMSPFLRSSLFCLCFIVFQFLLHISLNLSGWTQPRIWALVNYHWSKISPTLPGMLYLRHPCACDVRAPNKREQNVKLYLRISQTSFSCSSPPPSPALSSSFSCTSGTLQTQLPQSWKLHMESLSFQKISSIGKSKCLSKIWPLRWNVDTIEMKGNISTHLNVNRAETIWSLLNNSMFIILLIICPSPMSDKWWLDPRRLSNDGLTYQEY